MLTWVSLAGAKDWDGFQGPGSWWLLYSARFARAEGRTVIPRASIAIKKHRGAGSGQRLGPAGFREPRPPRVWSGDAPWAMDTQLTVGSYTPRRVLCARAGLLFEFVVVSSYVLHNYVQAKATDVLPG